MKNSESPFVYKVLPLMVTVLVAYVLFKQFWPAALAGSVPSILFLAWFILIALINISTYFLYSVFENVIVLPEDMLIQGEVVLVESSLIKVSIRKGVLMSKASKFIVVTNKRVIVAGNVFGFWTFKMFTEHTWFEDGGDKKGTIATSVGVNDSNDSLVIGRQRGDLDIPVGNPKQVLKNIGI